MKSSFSYPKIPDGLSGKGLTDRCTSQHPNHEHQHSIEGRPWFWNAWCSICKHNHWIGRMAGGTNPEMDAEYLATAAAKAKADHEEQQAGALTRKLAKQGPCEGSGGR